VNPRHRVLLLGAAFLMIAACADTDQGVTAGRSEEAVVVDTAPAETVPDESSPDAPDDTQPDETQPDETQPDETGPDATDAPTTDPLEPPEDTTPPPPPSEQLIDFGDEKTPRSYDNFLAAAFIDVTEFWKEQFPAIYDGAAFTPVSHIFAHYPGRSDLPESPCVGEIAYEDAELNAFYQACNGPDGRTDVSEDIIVYDDELLFPALSEKLGDAALGIVVAHEYGHAISARAGEFDQDPPLATVETEQQADCFAGAWAAHVARGESALLPAFGDAEVKAGLAAMIEVRDPVGFDAADPRSHGTAFDRVGAFQEGFRNGTERCRDFTRGRPNPRIDLVFTSLDVETGGNLPYDDILDLLPPSLDTFWLPTLENAGVPFEPPTLVSFPTDGPYPECRDLTGPELKNRAVFCPESNTIAYDDDFVRELYQRHGDISFGYPIAGAYSDAVQASLGFTLTGEPQVLLSDCLVGSWVIDIAPVSGSDPPEPQNPDQEILLSAGDLDEVVLTAVLLGDDATDTNQVGTAFEKIDAFRTGVLSGLPGCQERFA
jgi:predicted metalloprotease